MDVSSVPERRPEDQPADPSPAKHTPAELDERLAAIEAGMADLGRRLDHLGASVEATVRNAVGAELRAVSTDLRHSVSQLGRLLVRDLGKLGQLLAQHRDAIVAELAPMPTGEARVEAPPAHDDVSRADDAVGEDAVGEDAVSEDGGERPRRGRLRRRGS